MKLRACADSGHQAFSPERLGYEATTHVVNDIHDQN